MLSYLKLTVLLSLFLWATDLFSQTVWSGKISNTEGMDLANVHVMIRDAGNEKIYAFAASSKDGSYALNYTGEISNKKLVFRLLGYDEESVDLLAVSFPYHVVLIPTDHVLNEIVIKPPAIRIKKDTTEYLVSEFSDGTERSIEEVLKKMPGINVDDDGTISFKGKEIEKILLDDTDMFDKNYTIASKSVPFNFIDKVQAIENYHDNHLLKDAENSDKIVLNLNVRENLKISRPVGQMIAEGGYENRYALQPNLLSISKKLKLYNALNVNNVNSSPFFSLGQHLNSMYEHFDTYTDTEVVNNYSMLYDEGNIRRAETRQLFNSLNLVYQPARQLQITGNLLFDQRRKSFTDHTETLYFSDSLWIDDTSHVKEKPQTFYGMLRLKYDMKENMSLTYSGKFNSYKQSARNELYIPEARLSEITGNNRFLINDLDLTIALMDSSAVVFKALAASNRRSQDYGYLILENESPEITQTVEAATSQYNVSVKYYNKKQRNFSYSLQTSLNRNNQDVNVEAVHLYETNQTNASLYDTSFLIDTDFNYAKGVSSIAFRSGVGYRQQLLNRLDNLSKNDRRFEFSPHLSYQLKLKWHKILVYGSYTQGKFSPLNYLDYFSDYRNNRAGADVYIYGSTIGYGASYVYSGPLLQPFFHISYFNTINKNVYARQTHIGSMMNYSTLIPGRDSKSQMIITQFKTYIDDIRHGFDLNSSLYLSNYSNAVNSDVLRDNKMLSSHSHFSIKSVYDIPFNYTLGVRFNYSSVQTDVLPSYHTIHYSLFQKILYKPIKRLKINIALDEYFLGKNHDLYLFIRPDITYLFPKQRLSIGFDAYNILNYTKLTNYYISDYYSTEANYSIVPSQYLLNIQFQF